MLTRFRKSPNLTVNNLEGNSQAYPKFGYYLIIIIIIIIIIMCNRHIMGCLLCVNREPLMAHIEAPNKMDLIR